MSEWITDRLPTKEDADDYGYVWISDRGKVVHTMWDCVTDEAWTHFTRPAPYAKPKRWTPKPYVAPMGKHYAMFYMGNTREDWSWRVYDGSEYVASKLSTQNAAERIAAIYNEVMS